MAYSAIIVTPIGAQADPYVYAITDEEGSIIEEMHDHGLGNVVTATSIFFNMLPNGANSAKQIIQSLSIKLEFYVTDSRVVLRCEKYDKGSSWSGGLAALALDAASSIAAAARRKGKVMLGHIRYEWIRAISYSQGQIIITYIDTERNNWTLSLLFKRATDTEFIAHEILRRTCAYRLAMTDERDEKDEEFYKKYASGGKIPPSDNPKKSIPRIQIPVSYLAPGGKKFRPEWGTPKKEESNA